MYSRPEFDHLVVHCKKEPYDIYIGRPSIFGNPFVMKNKSMEERLRVVKEYYEWLTETRRITVFDNENRRCCNWKVKEALPQLKGKILACWCSPALCHGHVLAELANEV